MYYLPVCLQRSRGAEGAEKIRSTHNKQVGRPQTAATATINAIKANSIGGHNENGEYESIWQKVSLNRTEGTQEVGLKQRQISAITNF